MMPKESPNNLDSSDPLPANTTKKTPTIASDKTIKKEGLILCPRKRKPITATKIGAVFAINVA